MKIIHIVLGKANPNRMNGVNKVVHQLATAQLEAGMNVEVWGLTHDLEAPVVERDFQTRLFPAGNKEGRAQVLQSLSGTDSMVHFHGGFIPAFAKIAKRLVGMGIPYCITPHGSYNVVAMEKSKWKKRAYMALVEKALLRRAHAVHCIGASEKTALMDMLPEAEAVLIPNGQQLPGEVSRGSRKTKGPVQFGFCGRLRAHTKGLDILLKAFADFRKGHAGELLVIGDGDDRAQLERMAMQLDIADGVRFVGAKFGAEKEELLMGLDAFLHPSRNEGMPGAVLEAAGMGIPVIVSKETNLAEAVQEAGAGIALGRNDAGTLAEAMREAFRAQGSGQQSRWSQNARQMVAHTFSWKRIALLHLQMYQA